MAILVKSEHFDLAHSLAHRHPGCAGGTGSRPGHRQARTGRNPARGTESRYSMCTPEIAREITSRWISAVPSKMS
jgi:hypothetical protein